MSSRSKTNLTTTFEYDALGRRTGVIDPRTGATITHYNDKNQVDYVEDAAFALLLERRELRGRSVPPQLKDRCLTLYFAKHREATRDLPPIDLFYDYAKCEFQVV